MNAPMSALIALSVALCAGEAIAQSSGASSAANPAPPAIQRSQIRHDTPAEREEFLKRRQAQQNRPTPERVPPLAAQTITPVEVQRQR